MRHEPRRLRHAESGLTVTCALNFSSSIAANDAIVVTLRGVTNPGVTGPIAARVTTTSDTDQATSANAAAVVTAHAVGTPAVVNSQPSAAAGARTCYVVDFDLSSTGGLSGEAGSQINLTHARRDHLQRLRAGRSPTSPPPPRRRLQHPERPHHHLPLNSSAAPPPATTSA